MSPLPLLSFSGVCKRRLDGTRATSVLADVSFELGAGEAMGVYGRRGSGKSTLLRLAAGLDPTDRGSVSFDGRPLQGISAAERARLLRGPIALLGGGQPPIGGETVMDHVAVAAGAGGISLREARRRAIAALDDAGVAGSSAEENTLSLPPATRARVALARALVRSPRLLLVDEPAPLPSLLERERFCALLRELPRERSCALLVASEELACLQGLPVLGSLSGGQLSCSGSPGTVVELPRRRAATAGP